MAEEYIRDQEEQIGHLVALSLTLIHRAGEAEQRVQELEQEVAQVRQEVDAASRGW